MKVAILVDGGYYRKRATHVLGKKDALERAQELYDYCYKHLFSNKKDSNPDYLYRIFYYDCPPIDKNEATYYTSNFLPYKTRRNTSLRTKRYGENKLLNIKILQQKIL